jgi:outer membrane protein, heavy metal efflux system
VGQRQAERSLDLAKLDQRPDFAFNAGLMPRGSLDPMWQVQFVVGLPLFSGRKQKKAVAEQEWRRQAQGSEAQSTRTLLAQRTRERSAQLEAARATLKIYREGLLIQSEAGFQAALAQYESGRMPFLGAMDALNGWVADVSGMLQSLSQAHALAIALEEFTPGPTPPISATALPASAIGMGGAPGGSYATPSAASAKKGGSDPASPMKTM